MRRSGLIQFGVALLACGASLHASPTNALPDFKEVYDLLRANLPGVTEADLNRAAVEGLLANLHGKVSLVGSESSTGSTTESPVLRKAVFLEDSALHVQVGRVGAGLAEAIREKHQEFGKTNQIKGVALDLRFAGGDEYSAAAAAADVFLARKRALLDWGDGPVFSTEKADAIQLPVAVLVNRHTSGAAEALAAVLRETGCGVILGGTTAGGAMRPKEFSLTGGQRLRIAATPVKLGDGTTLTAEGVRPDIEITVNLEEERVWLNDAYAQPGGVGRTFSAASPAGLADTTNRVARRPRPNEADLVRARREGLPLDAESPGLRELEPEKPLIRDPVLARAVDLLKGLALVRRPRS